MRKKNPQKIYPFRPFPTLINNSNTTPLFAVVCINADNRDSFSSDDMQVISFNERD
jgi:hypothetical protein